MNKTKLFIMGDGSSPHTYNYMKYFIEKDKNYDITLFSMRPVSDLFKKTKVKIIENKIVPTNFIFWLIYYIYAHFKFYKILKNVETDIIHVHDVYRYGSFASMLKKDFLLTPWGTDILINPKKNILAKYLVKFVLKKARYLIYDGTNIYDKLIELGVQKEKIKYFGFGIDINKFSKKKKKNILKEKYKNKTLIISTRNLERVYDIDTLIKSAKNICYNNKNVQFLIVGTGTEENRLKTLVKEYKIQKQVSFLGKISQTEMADYLSFSDIYISTSLSDGGIATSTVEAMASELPIIITDFAENSQWAINEKTGFIFKMSNVKELTQRIEYCLKNPKKTKEMGKNSRKFITENYNYNLEKKKLEKFYMKVKNGN